MPIRDTLEETFFRIAASGLVPRRFFAPVLPERADGPPTDGTHELEIVSHCWRYGRLLTYQLSSLVLHPPRSARVRMTVFYTREDPDTARILEFFGRREVPNVTWNWWPLERTRLCRRSIGRNLAARATPANWILFTDCDVTFQERCLDRLVAELADCPAVLAFPREHQVSEMLAFDDPILQAAEDHPAVLELDLTRFHPETRDKAVGGFQLVPGDVARVVGYCANIGLYQRPLARMGNTWEDRTFRWLLGTHGTPLATSDFYRIRHAPKGRRGGDFRVKAGATVP
jgi:hypothetical protein